MTINNVMRFFCVAVLFVLACNRGLAAEVAAKETPRDAFHLLPGFQVEHLVTAPKDELGSWVSMTVDDKGRLLVCDQGEKGICRLTPGRIGTDEKTKVEH